MMKNQLVNTTQENVLTSIWPLKDEEIVDILPLEDDEEKVKEGKGIKILTLYKLLTRLPVLLTEIKAGNNSYKIKHIL